METKFYDLDDELNFGKYKDSGKTVEDIIEEDPDYIRWCIENIETISFSDDIESMVDF
jgi:hypothetical protein